MRPLVVIEDDFSQSLTVVYEDVMHVYYRAISGEEVFGVTFYEQKPKLVAAKDGRIYIVVYWRDLGKEVVVGSLRKEETVKRGDYYYWNGGRVRVWVHAEVYARSLAQEVFG